LLKKSIALFSFLLLLSSVCFAEIDPSNVQSTDLSNTQTLEISRKDFHVKYNEAANDEETGWMNGLHVAYKNQNLTDHTYWRLLYENTNQNDHYNGATQSGTPLQTITNNVKRTEEITFGQRLDDSGTEYVYVGIGSYNWDRNITGPSGLLEKYSWNYIPIGYRNEHKINDKWNVAADIAVRFQFNSKMTLYMPPFDNTNYSLGTKPGFKAELPFTYKMNSQWSLTLSPWYEYWGIQQSNSANITYQGIPVTSSSEPDSHTDQYGLDIGIVCKF